MKYTLITVLFCLPILGYATADSEKALELLFGARKRTYRIIFNNETNERLNDLYKSSIMQRPAWCQNFSPIERYIMFYEIKALEEYLYKHKRMICSFKDVTLQHNLEYRDLEDGSWSALVELSSHVAEQNLIVENLRQTVGTIVSLPVSV